jgi:hypothetical protein
MWKRGVTMLAKAFFCDLVEMIRPFEDCLCNRRQFDSVKNLFSNYQRSAFVADQQFDTHSFADLEKRLEAFPATERGCKSVFINYIIWYAIPATKCLIPSLSICW